MPIEQDIRRREAQRYIDTIDNNEAKQQLSTVKDKFGISLYNYPSDLGSPDLQHYVQFNINVRGKSKYNEKNRLQEVRRNTDSANLSEQQLGNATAAGVAAGGAALGYAAAKALVKRTATSGALSTPAGQTAVSAGGAVIGAAAGYTVASAGSFLKPDTSYRISDVIALHVDGPPTVKYNMNYANKELGTLAGLVSGGAFEGLKNLATTPENQQALITSFAKLPGALGMADLKSAMSVSSKTSLNPFKEVIFESVDFRSFAFKYKFMPKNQNESKAVQNIVNLFKFHMHPEMSANKLFFIYPAEFQISYYFGNQENQYFHKFAPCALESMDVSYGGETFSSFHDGTPTEVNMSLTFRELEILTKPMVERGF